MLAGVWYELGCEVAADNCLAVSTVEPILPLPASIKRYVDGNVEYW